MNTIPELNGDLNLTGGSGALQAKFVYGERHLGTEMRMDTAAMRTVTATVCTVTATMMRTDTATSTGFGSHNVH